MSIKCPQCHSIVTHRVHRRGIERIRYAGYKKYDCPQCDIRFYVSAKDESKVILLNQS